MTRSQRAGAYFLVAIFAVPLAVTGDTIDVCINDHSGEVKAVAPVDACRPHERRVTLATGGPTSARSLVVRDAVGRQVGVTANVEDDLQSIDVVFEIGGHVFSLDVLRTRLEGHCAQNIAFESTDCSGQAYFLAEGKGPLSQTQIVPPGLVFVEDREALRPVVNLQSVREADGTCTLQVGSGSGIPASPLLDISTAFTAPYRAYLEP